MLQVFLIDGKSYSLPADELEIQINDTAAVIKANSFNNDCTAPDCVVISTITRVTFSTTSGN